jgi:hypothetical protein
MHDANKYKLSIVPLLPDGSLRFHLGEPIKVNWRAPLSHSRRDWIGIYRVCPFNLSHMWFLELTRSWRRSVQTSQSW